MTPIRTLLACLLALIAVFTSSCSKDCDTDCGDHGRKVDCNCICDRGWTGADCNETSCSPVCIHGDCVDGGCDCYPGWEGPACDVMACVPACVNGDCVGGICHCEEGWEGVDCATLASAKVLGDYSVRRQQIGGPQSTYLCTIHLGDTSSSLGAIYFENMAGWGGLPIYATVDSLDIRFVGTQYLVNSGSFFVQFYGASGSIFPGGDSLVLEYTTHDPINGADFRDVFIRL